MTGGPERSLHERAERPLLTDTHVHFHDLRLEDVRYSWLMPGGEDEALGEYAAIRAERYWADDFLAETRFQGVARAVHVQAADGGDPVAETRWIQAFHDRLGAPAGAVAYADLASPQLEATLAGHLEHSVVRGIRDLRGDDYLTDARWERGFARLGDLGLVCCDALGVDTYGIAAELARRHPGTTLCLDHAGFPRRRDREYFDRWRAGLAALAAVPSVVVKISGLGMADPGWSVDSLRPWVLAALELFGSERCMLGTNWPVDRLYSSYGDVLEAYDEILSGCSEAERQAVFSANADRVFRL